MQCQHVRPRPHRHAGEDRGVDDVEAGAPHEHRQTGLILKEHLQEEARERPRHARLRARRHEPRPVPALDERDHSWRVRELHERLEQPTRIALVAAHRMLDTREVETDAHRRRSAQGGLVAQRGWACA